MNTTKIFFKKILLSVRPLRRLLERLEPFRIRFIRNGLARKYLTGSGLEIGAMHSPVKPPAGVRVSYVDVASREESIGKFPEIAADKVVPVDFVTDGFILENVPDGAFDFLIANHVLEHSPDPIGALVRWHQVLRPGGVIYCSVPLVDYHFDKGRPTTTYEHLREDYEAYRSGVRDVIDDRNRPHYREWVEISHPAVSGEPPPASEDVAARRAEALLKKGEEIHFHTFTLRSARELFEKLGTDILPGLSVLEVVKGRGEAIVIARKAGADR